MLVHETWWWARMCRAVSEERWCNRWQSPPWVTFRRQSKLDSKGSGKGGLWCTRWQSGERSKKSKNKGHLNAMGDKVVCSDGKLQWEDRWEGTSVVTKLFAMRRQMRGHISGDKFVFNEKSNLSGDQALPPIVEHTDLRAASGKWLFHTNSHNLNMYDNQPFLWNKVYENQNRSFTLSFLYAIKTKNWRWRKISDIGVSSVNIKRKVSFV